MKEADKTNEMPWSGMLDGVAEKYNGNLKTVLLLLVFCLDVLSKGLPIFY